MLTHEATVKRTPVGDAYRYVWLYLAVLAAASFLAAGTAPRLGLYLYLALLLFALLRTQFLAGREQDFHVALAVVPLFSILSLTAPAWAAFPVDQGVPRAILLSLGSLLVARALGYNPVGSLQARALLYLPLFVVAGSLVGASAFLVLRPPAPGSSLNPGELLGPVLSFSFVAFSEELLFRGVLLTAAVGLLGARQGVTLAALFYASLFLGQQPWSLVGLALVVGLGFGWLALRTRSVLGVSLAHALAAVTLFIVFPITLLSTR